MEDKNKLAKVLTDIFKTYVLPENQLDYHLTPNDLKNSTIGREIFSCDEFSKVDSIEIVDAPCFILADDAIKSTVKQTVTFLATDETKFKGKIYIYSIGLTTEHYDMTSFTNVGEDNILITPLVYDEKSFVGKKGITLFFNPEVAQDLSVASHVYNSKGEKIQEDKFRKSMHRLLDKALDNTDKYKAKGFRKAIIRGYFPELPECKGEHIKIKL